MAMNAKTGDTVLENISENVNLESLNDDSNDLGDQLTTEILPNDESNSMDENECDIGNILMPNIEIAEEEVSENIIEEKSVINKSELSTDPDRKFEIVVQIDEINEIEEENHSSSNVDNDSTESSADLLNSDVNVKTDDVAFIDEALVQEKIEKNGKNEESYHTGCPESCVDSVEYCETEAVKGTDNVFLQAMEENKLENSEQYHGSQTNGTDLMSIFCHEIEEVVDISNLFLLKTEENEMHHYEGSDKSEINAADKKSELFCAVKDVEEKDECLLQKEPETGEDYIDQNNVLENNIADFNSNSPISIQSDDSSSESEDDFYIYKLFLGEREEKVVDNGDCIRMYVFENNTTDFNSNSPISIQSDDSSSENEDDFYIYKLFLEEKEEKVVDNGDCIRMYVFENNTTDFNSNSPISIQSDDSSSENEDDFYIYKLFLEEKEENVVDNGDCIRMYVFENNTTDFNSNSPISIQSDDSSSENEDDFYIYKLFLEEKEEKVVDNRDCANESQSDVAVPHCESCNNSIKIAAVIDNVIPLKEEEKQMENFVVNTELEIHNANQDLESNENLSGEESALNTIICSKNEEDVDKDEPVLQRDQEDHLTNATEKQAEIKYAVLSPVDSFQVDDVAETRKFELGNDVEINDMNVKDDSELNLEPKVSDNVERKNNEEGEEKLTAYELIDKLNKIFKNDLEKKKREKDKEVKRRKSFRTLLMCYCCFACSGDDYREE